MRLPGYVSPKKIRQLLGFVLLTAWVPNLQAAESPAIRLALVAGSAMPEVVYDPRHDGCGENDIPDAGARAFRDSNGEIHLIAAHFENRQSVGQDFYQLQHHCALVFQSHQSGDPSAYDDRSWLTAFYTDDGKTVHALIHHEYVGSAHSSDLCKSGNYTRCWENSVLSTRSSDGGVHYAQPRIPSDLIATTPFTYIGEAAGKNIGYFQPSNIMRRGEFYLSLIYAEGFGHQQYGVCLFGTRNLTEARSWRAWDGERFSVSFPDPYRERVSQPTPACQPVGLDAGLGYPIMSLVEDQVTGNFVATLLIVGQGTEAAERGVYYTVSRDLIQWSKLSRLWAVEVPWVHVCGTEPAVAYPALIDQRSPDRNFGTISPTPALFLYYTEFEYGGCGAAVNRRLMRRPVLVQR